MINFWYEFDDTFTYHTTPKIESAKREIEPEGTMFTFYINHNQQADFLNLVRQKYSNQILNFRILSNSQLFLLDKHFHGNKELERLAFEEFAQGTLFDDVVSIDGVRRRIGTESIHMMNTRLLGYVIWHAFNQILLLIDPEADRDRWLEIERYLVLAADILFNLVLVDREPKPYATKEMQNIRLEHEVLQKLRDSWMYKGFEEINHKMNNLLQNI